MVPSGLAPLALLPSTAAAALPPGPPTAALPWARLTGALTTELVATPRCAESCPLQAATKSGAATAATEALSFGAPSPQATRDFENIAIENDKRTPASSRLCPPSASGEPASLCGHDGQFER